MLTELHHHLTMQLTFNKILVRLLIHFKVLVIAHLTMETTYKDPNLILHHHPKVWEEEMLLQWELITTKVIITELYKGEILLLTEQVVIVSINHHQITILTLEIWETTV